MAPRLARLAVFAVFFINGFAGASWFVRIPAIQQRLGLSTSQLGGVLLGLPAGAVVAMPLAGALTARYGSRRVNWIASIADCLTLALLGLAPNVWLLFGALLLFGAANGAMDVTMNAQGIAVERRYRRSIMAAFHGVYSTSGMLGAASGGVIAGAGVSARTHLAAVGLLLGVLAAIAPLWMLPHTADAAPEPHAPCPRRLRLPRAVLVLGLVGFCGLLAEGAMADWSAVYLRDVLATSAGIAAGGYTVFSLTMAVGRFNGDRLTDRLGRVPLVRVGSCVAAGGLALVALTPWWPLALLGFGLVGVGLSSVVPILFSAAGNTAGVETGQAIATMTTVSYLGFLAGPPLIGLLAGAVTLRGGFLVVVGLLLLMSALAGTVRGGAHARVVETRAVSDAV